MATNLELKARIQSPSQAHACARQFGAAYQGMLDQTDTYFRVPHGRLKLREFAEGPAEIIFYRRSEHTSERWCTYSREPVSAAAGLRSVLAEALGVLVVVRKKRALYLYKNARIHVDDVEGVGTFVEFEVIGEESPAAHATMRELKGYFAIDEKDIIKVSYSDLLLGKKEREA